MRRSISYFTLFIILLSGSLQGAESWGVLKVGMSSDEASEVLGEPLLKTIGRGFELWIYDNSAEAVFFGGPLVGWTAPRDFKAMPRIVDVWQRKPGAPNAPVYILPRPTKKAERKRELIGAIDPGSSLYRIGR